MSTVRKVYLKHAERLSPPNPTVNWKADGWWDAGVLTTEVHVTTSLCISVNDPSGHYHTALSILWRKCSMQCFSYHQRIFKVDCESPKRWLPALNAVTESPQWNLRTRGPTKKWMNKYFTSQSMIYAEACADEHQRRKTEQLPSLLYCYIIDRAVFLLL